MTRTYSVDPTPLLEFIAGRGWDDQLAATEMGLHPRTLWSWRQGLSWPPLEVIDRVAVRLGHHPASLMGPGWDAGVPIRPRLLKGPA